MNRDLNLSQTKTAPGHRHMPALVLALSAALGIAALFHPSDQAVATRHSTESVLATTAAVPLALPQQATRPEQEVAATEETEAMPEAAWREVRVKPGDTLAAIFARLGLSAQELHTMLDVDRVKTATLKQLLPGQVLRFLIDSEQKRLAALQYPVDKVTTLDVQRTDSGFEVQHLTRPLEIRQTHRSTTIDSSLFNAGRQVGLSDAKIMELANIFGWDIDFALDIRQGDTFTVVYEEEFQDGMKLGDGAILAAEFVNQGHIYRTVRFVDPQGNNSYYTPDGMAMRKAFLRSPVDFYRISSGFQPERYHPILGVKRPHRGVDYAAAIGTPIKAAGDGKVEFVGTKGGYGKTIVLQHGGEYSTLYGHLSRYKNGLRAGSRVRQGDVIGYVGKTGLATGPHLHYEFLVGGVHRNPLTVKLPNAEPIAPQHRAAFAQQAKAHLAQLETVKRTVVAANSR